MKRNHVGTRLLWGAVLVGFVAVGLIGLYPVGPAGAISAFPGANGSCNSGDYCLWAESGGRGAIADTPNAVSSYGPYGGWGESLSFDNRADSGRNRWTTRSARLYQNSAYSGWSQCNAANMNTLSLFFPPVSNSASSHRNTTGTTSC